MSEVLYTRVSEALKQALQAHAAGRGLSLTRAVVELLQQGLAAGGQERLVAELEAALAACGSERDSTRARFKESELRLQAAGQRDQQTAAVYAAVSERVRHRLGSCPRCREPVRGKDLLLSGSCPHCEKALTSLLLPAPRSNLDATEYTALLGALGTLAGLALQSGDTSSNHTA